MYEFAMIMDQQVGWRTQYLNWRTAVSAASDIDPTWVEVQYAADAGLLSRLPVVPSGIRGTLRGVGEIRRGMGVKRFDAVLWATWAAKSVPDLVGSCPAFLLFDVTPVQMEAMGDLYGYSHGRARRLGGVKRRATDRLYAAAKHFFPWSHFVALSLQEDYKISADRMTVVSPGVDLAMFHPNVSARMSDDVFRPLFVGGHWTRKGGDLLLRWIRERRVSGDDRVEAHVVTRDPDLQNEPGLVVHRGVQNNSPELIALYQSSDAFVLPTLADCYSFVGMEAMACGLPVVLTAVGGIPDIVEDGKTGYLIAPNDYAALKRSMDTLADDPGKRSQFASAAYATALERFDCRVNVARMLEKMREAAKQSTS